MTSVVLSHTRHRGLDHFEPEAALDPHEQRQLRGHLEQIDYAAFAANLEIVAKVLGSADLTKFQHLAVAAANARARWVASAVALAEAGAPPTPDQISHVEQARKAFEELADAYEAMRRMVERGYLRYRATP
jgi:long-subunit acyl-CoA synthetase (AMP-forming)